MSALVDLLSWVALLLGGALVVLGGVGLLRFPDFFTRLHAASLTDTLGAALIVFGLALQSGPGIASLKLALALAFLLFTGPAATHALAKAALHGSLRPVDVHGRELALPDTDAGHAGAPGGRAGGEPGRDRGQDGGQDGDQNRGAGPAAARHGAERGGQS